MLNQQASTSKSFLGVPDVANRWGVHTNFVYNLIKNGNLPCLKISNPKNPNGKRPMIRIPLAALEAYERSQTIGQGDAA
jgi:hypothetical protein